MSLHAQLSPEAEARLAAQRRNTTISSIAISFLILLFISILLLLLLLPKVENFTPEIISYSAVDEEIEKVTKNEITRTIQNKPSAPSVSMAKVIAANTTSTTAVPTLEYDVPNPSLDFGEGDDWGSGWGIGDGDSNSRGGNFTRIPATMRERCSLEDRLQRLVKSGGNKQCEDAVVRALHWLKETQNKDGSWSDKHQVGMTGLALLAYLGHCETPNSPEFGDTVTRAIVYLTDISMKNGGRMANDYKEKYWCYDHSIATYALGEAATFCIKLGIHMPNLNEATKKSGDWILNNQHDSGSWDYMYDRSGTRGGDNSIGLWHIQALKACKHTGLWDEKVFSEPIKIALMTGAGVLAFQMWGKKHASVVRKGTRYIEENAKFDYNTENSDLYRHYYHAQAMINHGGNSWKAYNDLFRDQLLKNQYKNGSWKNVGGGAKVDGSSVRFQGRSKLAKHYRTCLATLMLEVYYRFLPATGSQSN